MTTTPHHVGIIMDGNRRWAKMHGLVALRGHEYVVNNVIEPLVDEAVAQGIEYLTLWAFSTENWHRDQGEVSGLMNLFREAFKKNAADLHQKGVRLLTVGDLSRFPEDLQKSIGEWVQATAANQKITVIFALNYGGRDEIVRAVQQLTNNGDAVTEENISKKLDTGEAAVPDIDLIIRPGGELRLSGLYPWQAVYAELYFTSVLMPDFGPSEFRAALDDFSQRKRRFGA